MSPAAGTRKRVVVVGGGITGLAVAQRLKEHADVVVVEAADQVGGKFGTVDIGGVTFESGPDAFVAREPHLPALAAQLGLAGELISPAIFGAHIWTGGKLERVPPDFVFGMPTSPLAALRSGVLGPKAALRAGADLVLSGPLSGPDVSVGDFVRRRFGSAVLDRLVDPLLAGTRAGRADEISLAAALPQIDELARRHRSLAVGLARARRSGARVGGPPPFLAPRDGMRRLIEALADDLRGTVELRTGTPAQRIERRNAAYGLRLAGGETLGGDALVVTVPAYAAAALLGEVNPRAAGELKGIDYASVATAGLIFPPGSVTLPPDASGLLVPSRAGRTLAAATWFSRKWPHLAPSDGRIVIKAFAGRAAGDAAAPPDDERLLAALLEDLGAAVAIRARPLATHLTRWDRALPQYAVGHLELVGRIEDALRATPGILLAGAAYRGTGISDCVKSAQLAADRLTTSGALTYQRGPRRLGAG